MLQPADPVQPWAGHLGPLLSSGIYVGQNTSNASNTPLQSLLEYGTFNFESCGDGQTLVLFPPNQNSGQHDFARRLLSWRLPVYIPSATGLAQMPCIPAHPPPGAKMYCTRVPQGMRALGFCTYLQPLAALGSDVLGGGQLNLTPQQWTEVFEYWRAVGIWDDVSESALRACLPLQLNLCIPQSHTLLASSFTVVAIVRGLQATLLSAFKGGVGGDKKTGKTDQATAATGGLKSMES